MGRNDNPPTNVKNSCDFLFASGGLIGGPSAPGVFQNIIEGGASYTETEGGCDYNAPFVAAIASVVAEKDPVETTSLNTTNNDLNYNVYPTYFDDYIVADPIETNCGEETSIQIISINGTIVKSQKTNKFLPVVFDTSDLPSGNYILLITTSCGSQKAYKVVK